MSHAQLVGNENQLILLLLQPFLLWASPQCSKAFKERQCLFLKPTNIARKKLHSAFRLAGPFSVSSKEDQPKPPKEEKQ